MSQSTDLARARAYHQKVAALTSRLTAVGSDRAMLTARIRNYREAATYFRDRAVTHRTASLATERVRQKADALSTCGPWRQPSQKIIA